jgi:hypothetical protein
MRPLRNDVGTLPSSRLYRNCSFLIFTSSDYHCFTFTHKHPYHFPPLPSLALPSSRISVEKETLLTLEFARSPCIMSKDSKTQLVNTLLRLAKRPLYPPSRAPNPERPCTVLHPISNVFCARTAYIFLALLNYRPLCLHRTYIQCV